MDEIYAVARSSNQVDESKSTRLLRFRLMLGEDARAFRSKTKDGQINSEEFQRSNSYRELFGIDGEPSWVRVEYVPGTYLIGDPPKDPKRPARSKLWTWTFWRTDHLHVNVQWHRLDEERKFRQVYFEFRTSQELREEILCEDTGHSKAQPTNKNDTELSATHLKENGIPLPQKWWDISKRLDTQYSRASVLWVVKFWKRKGGRCTMHFNADSSNTELLFRTIHSANQLSIYGAVSSWLWRVRSTDSESKRVDNGEVRSKRTRVDTEKCEAARSEFFGANSKERQSGIWKQIARMSSEIWNTGERNPMYESLWRCDIREKSLCDELQNYSWRRWWFWRPSLSLQRIHTFLREDQNSRIHATIPQQTINGPVLQVHIVRHLDISGIETQIPSTTTKDRTLWCGDMPRENSPRGGVTSQWSRPQFDKRSELLEHIGLERSVAKERQRTWFHKDGAIMESLQSGNSKESNCSKEVLLIGERKWNDIPACQDFRGHTFEAEVSKLVMRLVRHYDQDERETDGAVHWNSMGPKLRKAFEKAGGHKFSDNDWLQKIYKGSNKTRFRYCKNSRDVLLYIRAIQGHTGGNVIAPELMGHVAIPYKMERIPVSSRMLWCHFNPQIRTHRRRTRKQRRKTDHLLRHLSTHAGTIQTNKNQAMTSRSREKYTTTASPLDQLSPSTRQRTAVLANQIPCRNCLLLCVSRLHLQSDFSKRGKNFTWKTLDRLVPHRR